MKYAHIAFLFAFMMTSVYAQDLPPLPPPPPPLLEELQDDEAPIESGTPNPPRPLQVQRPSEHHRPYDRVMYVLDVSCSMAEKLPDAIRVADSFVNDGFKAAVVTFTESHVRWDGVSVPCEHPETEECRDNCLEPGWAWMPAHRQELFRYLASFDGSGNTDPTAALDYAYKNAPSGTLIVFISDGIFQSPEGEPFGTVRAAKRWRQEQQLTPVQMLVWAPSPIDAQRESLIELAQLGGMGLWRDNSLPEPR